ncbi:glyoxylate reductase/hydroxypyruvate reductase-like [Saccostrea echinata]|uniref:glyoxylate reductase/hydroxypyruvate reductase-like n=1 Tax=Saccostrea echinata TaxID=191078 RepID=UPI002A7EC142|nr:glyoxylate reductase/hydroxypyruvate reductase-like [Saccostrea echinata]
MKPRSKIYVTADVPQSCLDVLLKVADISIWESSDPVPRGELLNGVRGVEALLCTSSDIIDKDVIECAGPNLCVIATMSEDVNHIDEAECQKRKIKVVTFPKMSKDTVANLTLALLSQTMGGLDQPTYSKYVLGDKTVGIVGYGHVGQAVAERFHGLGAGKLLYSDLTHTENPEAVAEFVNFERLVTESDIICICCKDMTNSTHMFQKDVFRKMKKDAILLDSYSKGHIINYPDLYNALRENRIYAAGLDVRDVNQTHPFKTNLNALYNCYFFPYRECNHVWDLRSAASASVARSIAATLRVDNSSEVCER